MKFRTKIWALPIAAALVLGTSVSITTLMRSATSEISNRLQHASYPYLEQMSIIDRALDNFRSALQAAALEGNVDKVDEAGVQAAQVQKALDAAEHLPGHEEQAHKLAGLFAGYRDVALAATQALVKQQVAPEGLRQMQAAQARLMEAVKAEIGHAREAVAQDFDQAAQYRRRTEWVTNGFTLAVLVTLGLGAHFLVISLWRDLGGEPAELRRLVQHVAEGDLAMTIPVYADDKSSINSAVASMTKRLREAVSQIRHASDSISTGSGEIATGNQDLSTRTEQTAANLQQTSSELERITNAARQSNEAAQHANQIANLAADAARHGGDIVSSMVGSMSGIDSASGKITEIIGVIDGIAFQTNILALNAAVEAARAGEQGRGFAVVAGEVRTLAQRSAQAAREIKGLIQASTEKVQDGTRLAADARKAMGDIVAQVQRVSDTISDITTALTDQSGSIEHVNRAVSQLEQMTQQNAALVEQSAAAATSMQGQAEALVGSVAAFRLSV